jgi:hypothetical protein
MKRKNSLFLGFLPGFSQPTHSASPLQAAELAGLPFLSLNFLTICKEIKNKLEKRGFTGGYLWLELLMADWNRMRGNGEIAVSCIICSQHCFVIS